MAGVLFRPDAEAEAGPGILVVHGGAGLDGHAREQARRYSTLGYVVLAADMFGPGAAGDRDKILACLHAMRDDPELMVHRVRAGLRALDGCPGVSAPLAVVGFCFGGMAALALARAGAAVPGVVSVHGTLATNRPAGRDAVSARVLVCHGGADPHVPWNDVTSFAAEMEHARADWQLVVLGQAEHGFTHSDAEPGGSPGIAYHPAADRRALRAIEAFLADLTPPRGRRDSSTETDEKPPERRSPPGHGVAPHRREPRDGGDECPT